MMRIPPTERSHRPHRLGRSSVPLGRRAWLPADRLAPFMATVVASLDEREHCRPYEGLDGVRANLRRARSILAGTAGTNRGGSCSVPLP